MIFGDFNKRNPDPLALLSDDPWVVVAEALSCASCKYTIPGHLGIGFLNISRTIGKNHPFSRTKTSKLEVDPPEYRQEKKKFKARKKTF